MRTVLRNRVLVFIFLVLAGLAGAGLVVKSVSNLGPGLTHDSVAYIFASRSLLEGRGFEYFGYPSPFIQWPPLYPILLAAADLIGIRYLEASGAINTVAHGLIIVVAGYWFYSRLKCKLCAVLGTILLVFSLPLIQVSKYVWTEILFILLYILFYVYFEKYIKSSRLAYLVAAGIFSALAFIDRYAGVTIVLTAVIFILFQRKTLRRRIIDILIYGFTSCLPFAMWVVRNYLVSNTLMGVRLPSTYSLRLNIERSILALKAWITPDAMLGKIIPAGMIPVLMSLSVLIPLIIIVIFILVQLYRFIQWAITKKKSEANVLRNSESEASREIYPVVFMGAYTAVYMIYLLASATRILFEPINFRYLVPVYVPLLIVFVYSLDFLAGKFVHVSKPVIWTCLSLISGMLILYPAINTVATVAGYAEKGAGGYSMRAFYENKLAAYIRENPTGITYYSNSADMVTVLSGVRTYYLPKKEGPFMYGLEQFQKAVDRDKASYLIWFKGGVSPKIYGVEEIGRMYKLEVVKVFEAGTVYKILERETLANE